MTEPEPPAPAHDFALAYAEEDMGPSAAPFVRTPSADGQGVVVEGLCPRCHGRTSTEYRYGAPGTGTKGVRAWLTGRHPAPAEDADADLLTRELHFCECGHPHTNLPQDAPFTGCGASWRIGTPTAGRVS
ncbi:hypothetical protein ACGFWE_34535 [Streptomyces sp. NPDC048523]|uniref:hypothetical protein n=1 Tax=Streptomyces sp. NPDC048523 TaxID=3365567 RepID=UPI0037219FC7